MLQQGHVQSLSQRRQDPTPQLFGSSYLRQHRMTHSNQILHGDQTGREEGRPLPLPWPKISVTQMLTRDLFAVVNLLVQNDTSHRTQLAPSLKHPVRLWSLALFAYVASRSSQHFPTFSSGT